MLKDRFSALITDVQSFEHDLRRERGIDVSVHSLVRDHLEKLLNLSIQGIEATQGIQYFRSEEHLTDADDQQSDNSMRLVANKAAWIRVYVAARFTNTPGVSASLKVFRRHFLVWQELGELSPEAPGSLDAVVNPDYSTQRENLGQTLNFVVPAAWMCGAMRFDVKVSSATGQTVSASLEADVTLRQTLAVRYVPIAYNGPDTSGSSTISLPAPDLADGLAEAGWALRIYPVQETPDVSLTAQVELDFPLTGSPSSAGGCASSWIDLNVMVAEARTADGNLPDVFYYGLVPSGVPLGANSGCASSGVSSGVQGTGRVLAHELGHNLGFAHAPCGNVGTGDVDYPTYEPYDSASIGEYGLDIDTGEIHSPATRRDYMSYCGPRWISLRNYGRCINHPKLSPEFVCEDEFEIPYVEEYDPWWWLKHPVLEHEIDIRALRDPRQWVVSIIGVHRADGSVEVRSIRRALAAPGLLGTATDMVAEAFDAKGEALASATVYRLPDRGLGCTCGDGDGRSAAWAFQALIQTEAKLGALQLRGGERSLWRSSAPERAPEAAKCTVGLTRNNQKLRVQWTVGRGDRGCGVVVRYRHDKDVTKLTRVLAIGRGSGRADIDVGSLLPGRVHIEVVVQDGFNEIVSKPVTVSIPTRSPTPAIVSPQPGQRTRAGAPLRLRGLMTAQDGRPASPGGCRWRLDGKIVGEGLQCRILAPGPGKHELQLEYVVGKNKSVVKSSKREFETR